MCVHSEDDAQHELKGEKKVVEEGGGSEEEEEEGKRVSMANSECSSFSRSTSYTRTVIQKNRIKTGYNVHFHWKVRIALQKMLSSRFMFSITAALPCCITGTRAILTRWRCDNRANSFIDFGVSQEFPLIITL